MTSPEPVWLRSWVKPTRLPWFEQDRAAQRIREFLRSERGIKLCEGVAAGSLEAEDDLVKATVKAVRG